MSTRWRFTPTELLVMWPLLGVSRFPYPFDVRASGDTTDEWAQLQSEARLRLSSGGIVRDDRLEADVEAALLALVHPRVSIDAYGYFGDRDESVVRVLGVHAGGPGVVAMQLPGASEQVGGDVTVEVLTAAQLAHGVVHALPPAPQGSEPALRLAASELSPQQSGSVAQPVALTPNQRGRAQLNALTKGPLLGAGEFGVSVWTEHGEPARNTSLRWFDRAGDGRYLMSTGSTITVRSADSTVLADALTSELEHLRTLV